MDLLVVLRALTLAGWISLAVGTCYVVVAHGRQLPAPAHGAWTAVAVRHGAVALTTVLVEAAAVAKMIRPESWAAAAGKALYNPAYLLNATASAMIPFVVLALLGRGRSLRYGSVVAATGIGVIAVLAVGAGAATTWGVLMSWTQALSFLEIVGYLTLWALMLLGHARPVDPYLVGILVITGLYTLLLPIQVEFFEVVGRDDSDRIWHLNQFLQLVVVATSLAAVLAHVKHLRNDGTCRVVDGVNDSGDRPSNEEMPTPVG